MRRKAASSSRGIRPGDATRSRRKNSSRPSATRRAAAECSKTEPEPNGCGWAVRSTLLLPTTPRHLHFLLCCRATIDRWPPFRHTAELSALLYRVLYNRLHGVFVLHKIIPGLCSIMLLYWELNQQKLISVIYVQTTIFTSSHINKIDSLFSIGTKIEFGSFVEISVFGVSWGHNRVLFCKIPVWIQGVFSTNPQCSKLETDFCDIPTINKYHFLTEILYCREKKTNSRFLLIQYVRLWVSWAQKRVSRKKPSL